MAASSRSRRDAADRRQRDPRDRPPRPARPHRRPPALQRAGPHRVGRRRPPAAAHWPRAAGRCSSTCRSTRRRAPSRPRTSTSSARRWKRSSITDFGLWGGLVPGHVGDMAAMADRGVVGFKAFMCSSGLPEFPRADDRTLLDGLREAARLGLPVAVHAESEALVETPSGRDARDFLASRPIAAELEAIERALRFAEETGAKLHIVHVSSGRGVALAAEARARGVDVSIETCPHYLFFTDEDVERLGVVAKCAPPLRSADERQALWAALLRGEIDIVASDHSPAEPAMKQGDFVVGVGRHCRSAIDAGGAAPVRRRRPVPAPVARTHRRSGGCRAGATIPHRRQGQRWRSALTRTWRWSICASRIRSVPTSCTSVTRRARIWGCRSVAGCGGRSGAARRSSPMVGSSPSGWVVWSDRNRRAEARAGRTPLDLRRAPCLTS